MSDNRFRPTWRKIKMASVYGSDCCNNKKNKPVDEGLFRYTECTRRNLAYLWRMFFRLMYIDVTIIPTYIRSLTVTRAVPRPIPVPSNVLSVHCVRTFLGRQPSQAIRRRTKYFGKRELGFIACLMSLCDSDVNWTWSTGDKITETTYFSTFSYAFGNQIMYNSSHSLYFISLLSLSTLNVRYRYTSYIDGSRPQKISPQVWQIHHGTPCICYTQRWKNSGATTKGISKSKCNFSLTFWRRIFFFQILAHPVFKMWVIQKPNKVALWNKLHFEEKIMEIIQHV